MPNRQPPLIVHDSRGTSLRGSAAEYRHFSTLFLFLILRDVRLRFRQTAFGVGWAVLQPLLPMAVFAAVFSRLNFDTGGVPYPLFAFSGLAPWIFIANATTNAAPIFVNNFQMLNKVYFPRAILPGAAVSALVLDAIVAWVAVILLSLWYGYRPVWSWLLFPAVGSAAWILAVSAGLAAACLTALLRDIKNVVPFLVQVWAYASRVFYPIDLLPASVRPFAGLNPVAGVLAAFRACLFGTAPDWPLLGLSALALGVLVAGSIWLFHHVENDLAERV